MSANPAYLNRAIKKWLLQDTLLTNEDFDLYFSSSNYNGAKLLKLARHNLAIVINKLEHIDLSCVQNFDGLEQLTQLKEVRFFDNKLQELPTQLFALKNLEKLYIRTNPLLDFEQVCLQLKSFPRLKELYLENNALEVVPNNLKHLPYLEHLRFNNRQFRLQNEIREIPSFLLTFRQLKALHFEKNPIQQIPSNLFDFAQQQLKEFTLGNYAFNNGLEAKAYLNLFKVHGLKTCQDN